jgi:hypothetical protein
MEKHTAKTTHAHGTTHHASHKKSSGGAGKFILLAVVVVIAGIFWMKSTQDPDVLTDPNFNKTSLSGDTITGDAIDKKPVKVWEPVSGTKLLFGLTGECEQMFAEYYATYDNAITSLKPAEFPFGTAAVATQTWFDGAWSVEMLAEPFVDAYGYNLGYYKSGDAQGLGYRSGETKGFLAMMRHLSKDPTYTGTTAFLTETGQFDSIQYSGFTEKYRPLIGKQAIPCLIKFENAICDYLYVGMIKFPDRTMHDVQCYTQSTNGDVYHIASVDALNIFNPEVELDDYSENYKKRNNAIVWFLNHIRKN